MPRHFPLPPVMFLCCLVTGSLLHARWPVEIASASLGLRLGLALPLFALAVTVAGWALLLMHRARTPFEPGSTPLVLMTRGPFSRSRNPLYIALLTTLLAFALLLDSAWLLVGVVVLFVLLRVLVVAREEITLSAVFGPAYDDYRRRVRRWL